MKRVKHTAILCGLFLSLVFATACKGTPEKTAEPTITKQEQINYSETMTKEELMREAIRLSEENVRNGGGPFGAVIAKDGKIVATGVNRVTSNCDPTAHAEVSAVRAAAKALGTFDLSGYEIYTSCEPCPMCLGAIYWSHLSKMYYGNTKSDAKDIDFDDSFIYDEIALAPSERRLASEQLLHDESIVAFEEWKVSTTKVEY